MGLLEKAWNETQQPINFLASLITVGNVIIWPLYGTRFSPDFFDHTPDFPTGLLLLGIFEASLAIAFGWLVAWLGAHDRPGFVIGIFVMFLSAAVSIFNIQWLLFGHGVQLMEEKILLAGIAAISCWAACYLIGFHLRRRKSRQGVGNQFLRQLNNGGGLYGWQIFAFVVMYGAAVTPGP